MTEHRDDVEVWQCRCEDCFVALVDQIRARYRVALDRLKESGD